MRTHTSPHTQARTGIQGRLGRALQGCAKRGGKRDDVNRELELQELADVVEHGAAPHNRLDDGRKVVVQNDDVGRLLGDCLCVCVCVCV